MPSSVTRASACGCDGVLKQMSGTYAFGGNPHELGQTSVTLTIVGVVAQTLALTCYLMVHPPQSQSGLRGRPFRGNAGAPNPWMPAGRSRPVHSSRRVIRASRLTLGD